MLDLVRLPPKTVFIEMRLILILLFESNLNERYWFSWDKAHIGFYEIKVFL